MVIWPVMALEEWDMGRPMARMVISPPQGQPHAARPSELELARIRHARRLLAAAKVFERARRDADGDAERAASARPIRAWCRPASTPAGSSTPTATTRCRCTSSRTSAASIMKSMDIIEKFCGKRPRGWFGPGLTQTFDTLDYLSEAGIEYIGDWVLDDEPVTLKTTHKPVVALPYNFEIHDIVHDGVAAPHLRQDVSARAATSSNGSMRKPPSGRRSWRSPCHPYLSGVPHRIGHVAAHLQGNSGARRRRCLERRAKSSTGI